MIDKAKAMRSQAAAWAAEAEEAEKADPRAVQQAPPPAASSVLPGPEGCGLAPGDVAWAFLRGSPPWPCVVITKEEALRQGVPQCCGKKVGTVGTVGG